MDHLPTCAQLESREGLRSPRLLVQLGTLLALVSVLYGSTLAQLVRQWWNDPNFSHGFLVPLFSGFIIWRDWKRLRAMCPSASWLGLAVIVGALSILVVGILGAELFLSRSSLVLLLAGFVIYFLGWRIFRAVLFPWAFLFLMIPIPTIVFNQVAFPLQLLASRFADSVLSSVGVPVLREGNLIQLPAMSLEVAQACSGIRSLMSLGALAIIYGYFLDSSNLNRTLLALASIPVAILANGLRVVGTGLLVHYWDPARAQGFFHAFEGWVIFVLSLSMLFAVHSLLRYGTQIWQRGRA